MMMMSSDEGGSKRSGMREYRKGNWTVGETMVLIEAKKMDNERRMRRPIDQSSSSSEAIMRNKPAELRWKWIEDYCCRKGCIRSQNQCNDKWDNLMRDYKKVRDFERNNINNTTSGDQTSSSYWKMEKIERKDKNLPSNLLPQIYEALVEVVERKDEPPPPPPPQRAAADVSVVTQQSLGFVQPPMLLQHQVSPPMAISLPFPQPRPPPPPPPPLQPPSISFPTPPPPVPHSQPLPTEACDRSDSDTSEYTDSTSKRRRRRKSSSSNSSIGHEVSNAISKSASIIAEAIQASEERQDKRHRDLLSLQQSRLRIEESKAEIKRQTITGFVDAINNLANSIFALANHTTTTNNNPNNTSNNPNPPPPPK